MNKKVLCLLLCVVLTLCLVACKEEEKPRGVGETGSGYKYYVIYIPSHKKVTDYFTLTGAEGTITGMRTDANSYSEKMETVYNCRTEEGGWVAYTKNKNGNIIYMPEGFPEKAVAITCSQLATDPDEYGCLSITEAKELFPFIGQQIVKPLEKLAISAQFVMLGA